MGTPSVWPAGTSPEFGPCSAAGPGGKAEFPWRKLQKRKEAELESHFISIFGALLAGKSGTIAEPSWKICCNHYLCSLFIMHSDEMQAHFTHCKYGPFKIKVLLAMLSIQQHRSCLLVLLCCLTKFDGCSSVIVDVSCVYSIFIKMGVSQYVYPDLCIICSQVQGAKSSDYQYTS